MIDWPVLAAIATPILACVGVVVGAWVGRRAGIRQADAAVTQAESSARNTVTADWKAFSDSLQTRLGAVETRSTATEVRLDAAELRASAAEDRATVAEGMYKAAVQYLRQIAGWFEHRFPAEKLPPPPPELEGEL